ncbi:ABC transporter ATP-binding protein [Microvirga sp. VF16]|uniref:ABC transporter ATP-binding protein n=1 Tax=Microvirga sp. VF16 TaxID=2807101 RepID=UPI001FF039FC|nr:ABC transporter ATP-binding protein [Microvirga sp. VF16]
MDQASKSYLELKHLTKSYVGLAPAVHDLNLSIRKGELVSLLGASGCGKTTTLRMIAGLVEPTSGSVVIDGRDITKVPAHRRDIGVVFQSYALFPHLSVLDNVAFGLRIRGVARDICRKKAEFALSLVHLEQFGGRKPRELSGGQQQRVALARALVFEPTLLLLDEPLSNLDAKLRETMRDEIRRVQQELGITTVFVTHDQTEALTVSDRIAVMHGGSVAQFGTPTDIYRKPESSFVARFVGRMNVFVARAERRAGVSLLVSEDGFGFTSRHAFSNGQRVEVMIRPHDMSIDVNRQNDVIESTESAREPNAAVGLVEKALYSGETTQYHVRVGETIIISEVSAGMSAVRAAVGAQVRLRWKEEDVHCFEAA